MVCCDINDFQSVPYLLFCSTTDSFVSSIFVVLCCSALHFYFSLSNTKTNHLTPRMAAKLTDMLLDNRQKQW